MTSMTWTAAPAGFLGLGGSDVCGNKSAFALIGTAGADARLRPVVVHVPAERQPRIAPTYIAQNDGTTLGIHPSGRPQS
jgi:hypothetical protein